MDDGAMNRDPVTAEQIFTAITEERARQIAKWGVQNHDPAVWALIAQEEAGEIAKAVLEHDYSATGYVRELIQLAAVCVSAIESAARGKRCDKHDCACCAMLARDESPDAEES